MDHDLEEIRRRIDALPQRAVIPDEDAERWLRATSEIDPERVGWHVTRASGFGGSDASTVHAWAASTFGVSGETDPFAAPDRLVRQKLLRLPPAPPGLDARRGIALEPLIRQAFERGLDEVGAIWRHRDEEKAAIESGGHPRMPWLRASLDGLYEINGRLWIVDFKAPSEAALERHRTETPLSYRCQLAHYAVVAEGFGVPVSGALLAHFDYRRYGDEPVVLREVPLEPELQDVLVRGAERLWQDWVMAGRVPDRAAACDVALGSEAEAAAREFAAARRLRDEAQRRMDAAKAVLERAFASAGLDRARLAAGTAALSVSSRVRLDCAAAAERLGQAAESCRLLAFADPAAAVLWAERVASLARRHAPSLPPDLAEALTRLPEIVASGWDEERLTAKLRELGEDPMRWSTRSVTIRVLESKDKPSRDETPPAPSP